MSKCHFVSVVSWGDILKYRQKCEGCTHFCDTLYLLIILRIQVIVSLLNFSCIYLSITTDPSTGSRSPVKSRNLSFFFLSLSFLCGLLKLQIRLAAKYFTFCWFLTRLYDLFYWKIVRGYMCALFNENFFCRQITLVYLFKTKSLAQFSMIQLHHQLYIYFCTVFLNIHPAAM